MRDFDPWPNGQVVMVGTPSRTGLNQLQGWRGMTSKTLSHFVHNRLTRELSRSLVIWSLHGSSERPSEGGRLAMAKIRIGARGHGEFTVQTSRDIGAFFLFWGKSMALADLVVSQSTRTIYFRKRTPMSRDLFCL